MRRTPMRRSTLVVMLALSGCGSAPAEPPTPREGPTREGPPPSSASASGATATGVTASSAEPSAAPRPSSPPPAPPPTAIEGQPFVGLPVDGHQPAVVAVPVGATAPQPVMLATHGNYDTPEWQCATWRDIVGPGGFILCPRGQPRPDSPSRDDVRFTYANNAALEVEIEAALAALRARFGAQVAEGPIVYTGFSLGAIMGVAIAARAKHPGRYASMVLVEGGHDRWTPATARAFKAAGGARVLFGCGQHHCLLDARRAAKHLEAAGVSTQVVGVKDAGHDYGGRVAAAVKEAWPFVVGAP